MSFIKKNSADGSGIIGSLFISMKKGVSRGIFEVFADTIVVYTLTALVILSSGVAVNYGEAAGADLAISGFTSTYGSWVSVFTAIAICCLSGTVIKLTKEQFKKD